MCEREGHCYYYNPRGVEGRVEHGGGVQIERVWEIYSQREQASLMESRAD